MAATQGGGSPEDEVWDPPCVRRIGADDLTVVVETSRYRQTASKAGQRSHRPPLPDAVVERPGVIVIGGNQDLSAFVDVDGIGDASARLSEVGHRAGLPKIEVGPAGHHDLPAIIGRVSDAPGGPGGAE